MAHPNLHVFYPLNFWGGGPPETCYRICAHWPSQGLPVRIHAPARLRADPAGIMAPALPQFLPVRLRRRLAAIARVESALKRRCMARAVAAVRPGDLCYCWPGTPIDAIAAARARGGRIVLEFVNTHVAYAKTLLDAECDRIGLPRYGHFTAASLQYEAERIALADLIIAPGPFVAQSIRETAPEVPQIVRASYGSFLPRDLPPRPALPPNDRPLRFLFVGTVGVRKGAHILLEAWRRAALPAELWIAGADERHIADPALRDLCLGQIPASVRFLGHVSDMGKVYRDADAFVFPSLEEGDPQVTYEAAAHALPLIVTPTGGARIARDGENALVVPHGDAGALAAALGRLHAEGEMRQRLGHQAAVDAEGFSWERVADHRRRLLLDFAAG